MIPYQNWKKKKANIRISDGFKVSQYPIYFLKAIEGKQPSHGAKFGPSTKNVDS